MQEPWVRVGTSGVVLSRFGLGTAPLGGLFSPVDDRDADSTMAAAWNAGIRYFDTAPHYGLGLAERRLGRFLAGRPRRDFVVSTKVGRLLVRGDGTPGDDGYWGGPNDLVRHRDYSRDGVYRSIEDSLERTGLDRFDIVLIHDPDEHWEAAIGEAYPALADLRAQGVISAIGVGMNQWRMLLRFVEESDIDVVLVAGRYTLLDRSAEPRLLPACARRGVSVIAGGVFNSGVLAAPAADAHFDYLTVTSATLRRAADMQRRCAAYGVPLIAAAIQYPLRHPAVSAVLVGARNLAEVRTDLENASRPVPAALWDELDSMSASQ